MNWHIPFYNPCHTPRDPTSSWARSWSFNFGNASPPSSPPPSSAAAAVSAPTAPPPYTRFDHRHYGGFGSGFGFGSPYRTYCQPYWYGYGPPPPPGYFGQPGIGAGVGVGASVYSGFNTNSSSSGAGGDEKDSGDAGKDFEVRIDVSNYKPEELTVKTIFNTKIIVEGHKERQGAHTASSSTFEKSYKLPAGIPPENLQATITPDGQLLILSAKRSASPDAANGSPNERNINIETKKTQ